MSAANKVRGRVARFKSEAGFSQLHWMRLATSAEDLTEGVGAADPDSPSCPQWPMEEVRRHCSRDDAWIVLRGLVYNVTQYLRYHPGSVEEILRSAGDDSTVLFEEVHPWVSEAILEPCCVGKLAPPMAAQSAQQAGLHPDEWRSFRLVSTAAAASDSVSLRFELPAGSRLGLLVGEHLQLSRTGSIKEPHRAFTPVNALKSEGYFELLVRRVKSGHFSNWLYDLRVGEQVFARGPRGPGVYGGFGATRLRLPAVAKARGGSGVLPVSRMLLVSAGSGIAPMLALLRSLEGSAASKLPELSLVHASPSACEVGALAELLRLAASLPSLTLHFALGSCDGPSGGKSLDPAVAAAAAELADESRRAENVRLSVGQRLSASLLTQWVPKPAAVSCMCCCGPPNFDQDMMAWAKASGYDMACFHVF